MSESKIIDNLEDFLLDNPKLERLENLLGEFNIFETLKIVNAEIRHSNVLAWLLNPNSNHGLGDYFIRQFLKYLISSNKNVLNKEISLIDFEIFNYSNIDIRREWMKIDILLVLEDGKKKYVIAIENKVKTSEHGDQLIRYRNTIEDEFENHNKIFVYLTPDNLIPSDDQWITFNYKVISDLFDKLLSTKRNIMNENIFNFINHYNVILRRYIVGNSEIEQLCKQIYKKHKEALDIIYQYKPDIQLEISDYLKKLVNGNGNFLIYDSGGKSSVRFTTPEIDKIIPKKGEGWTSSKRVVLYEFVNLEDQLKLRLYIGPGEKNLREKLLVLFQSDPKLFSLSTRTLGKKWHSVYKKVILKKSDYEDSSFLDMKDILEKKIHDFLDKDLLKINEYFVENWKN